MNFDTVAQAMFYTFVTALTCLHLHHQVTENVQLDTVLETVIFVTIHSPSDTYFSVCYIEKVSILRPNSYMIPQRK